MSLKDNFFMRYPYTYADTFRINQKLKQGKLLELRYTKSPTIQEELSEKHIGLLMTAHRHRLEIRPDYKEGVKYYIIRLV